MSTPASGDNVTRFPGTENGHLLKFINTGRHLDDLIFPPVEYVVPGIVPEGTSVFAGAPKVGKSWSALSVALGVASLRGQVFGLRITRQRPVLYLALEDGDRRLQGRCRSLLGAGVKIPEAFEYITRLPGNIHVSLIEAWISQYRDARPLVIIDTLAKVMPVARPGETAYQRDYRSIGDLQTLISEIPVAALSIVHHTRKLAAEDFIDSVSGTQGISGAADTTLILTRQRGGDDGLLRVTGRDVPERDYAMTRGSSGAWTLSGGSLKDAQGVAAKLAAVANLSDRSTAIYNFVIGAGRPVSPADVAHAVPGIGREAAVYLGRLVENGRLLKVGRGLYQGKRDPYNTSNTYNSQHNTDPDWDGDE